MINYIKKRVLSLLDTVKGLPHIMAGTIASSVIMSIFGLSLANILGEESFGEISYLLSIGYVTAGITFIGTSHTMIVYVTKGLKIQSSLYFLVLISSSISSVAVFIIFGQIELSLFVIGYVLFSLILGEMLGKKEYRTYSFSLILQKILIVGFALMFYYFFGNYGIILGYGVACFPFFYRIIRSFKNTKINFTMLKEKSSFLINSYIYEFSSTVIGHVDKIVIAPLFGFAILGNYQIALQIVMLLNVIPSVVYQYTITQDSSGTNRKLLKKMTVLFSTVLVVIAYFTSPFIVPKLFPEFEHAVNFIQIMCFVAIPMSINSMLVSGFMGNEKVRIVVIGSTIYIVIQTIGIIISGQISSEMGIAISILVATTSQSFYLLWKQRSLQKTKSLSS
jgi:O-antigen/teichoic acid export membrane protein